MYANVLLSYEYKMLPEINLDGVWREMSGGMGEIFLWKMEKNANFARYF